MAMRRFLSPDCPTDKGKFPFTVRRTAVSVAMIKAINDALATNPVLAHVSTR